MAEIGTTQQIILLSACIFAAALLYSSVGHAGASGYLAAMALFGLAPQVMRPTALCLNILVASIASVRFWRAGCFSWRVFWPFAVTSVPLAFLGGTLVLPGAVYKRLVGLVLLFAAYQLLRRKVTDSTTLREVPIAPALGIGLGIGLFAGLTGVGGGIFLSPVLVLMGWAGVRQQAGITALFILANSIAGLGGQLASLHAIPTAVVWLAIAASAGGVVGSELGSRRLGSPTLRCLLASVLVVAAAKFAFA